MGKAQHALPTAAHTVNNNAIIKDEKFNDDFINRLFTPVGLGVFGAT